MNFSRAGLLQHSKVLKRPGVLHSDFMVWIFVLALAIVTLITIAVVITQGWLAASANPVDSLKNE